MDKITWAAKKVHAHEEIETFPDGYETFLEENATNLSTGLRQKIAIARALIRNPRVIILDDAITGFDVEILVGGNRITTNDISVQRLLMPAPTNQRYIAFTSPVLVLYPQPLQISVENNVAIAAHDMVSTGTDVATVRVKITLIGEIEIQKTVY